MVCAVGPSTQASVSVSGSHEDDAILSCCGKSKFGNELMVGRWTRILVEGVLGSVFIERWND